MIILRALLPGGGWSRLANHLLAEAHSCEEFAGEMPDGFPDDLNSSDHRVLPHPVIQKRLLRDTFEVVGNQRGCFGDMG